MHAPIAKLLHGWALAEDDTERGCTEISDGFAGFRATGQVMKSTHGHAMLAEAYLHGGNAERGLFSLDELLTTTKSEEQNFAAELCRLRGELLLLASRPNPNIDAKAEHLFREAIEVARSQSAKSLELRATASLARLFDKTTPNR